MAYLFTYFTLVDFPYIREAQGSCLWAPEA